MGYSGAQEWGVCSQEIKGSNPKNFGFESYGAHSRCFMAQAGDNKMKSACLRARCYKNQVYMKFGDEIFKCPKQGVFDVKLKAYQGKVQCPDSGKFCATWKKDALMTARDTGSAWATES